MKWYSADIGTYERGRVERFQARNNREALRKASEYGNVVQLRVNSKPTGNAVQGLGDLIWDEWNGGGCYPEWED